ncbi:hypothetical protein QJS10_CPB20g01251 [Acorus calamus]|uniref:Uncharacterized protein n=1 Tax=Acorus calamus TaxID=4465 RepID=A0AAV9CBM6_ACOCL|nr:hypothetical protein QJS10_CPB20g01251 [Acorus calamus]
MMMDLFLPREEEEPWKCRKHASHDGRGVCPCCLKNRLVVLCPDCRHIRPCSCGASSSSAASSSSSGSSSFSSASASADRIRSSSAAVGCNAEIGAVGRISALIDSEPPLQRSRSVALPRSRSSALQFMRSRSVASAPQPPENRKRQSLFSFFKSNKTKKGSPVPAPERAFPRSRSVGMPIFSDSGVGSGGDVRQKGKGWFFPSPMKAFRQRKTAKVVHERSPLCRG